MVSPQALISLLFGLGFALPGGHGSCLARPDRRDAALSVPSSRLDAGQDGDVQAIGLVAADVALSLILIVLVNGLFGA